MRKTVFVLTLLLAMSVATTALAAPRVDRVTGRCVFAPGGSIWTFHAFEGWGSPGDPDYRPASGWVKTENYEFEGVWPVVACEVFDDHRFVVSLDVNGYIWTSAVGYDGGSPGRRFDSNDAGYKVIKGNMKVHNFPDDGD
jgi:hypothetical protein